MPPFSNKKKLKKIEKKKDMIRKINRFLNNNFKWLIVMSVLLVLTLSYFNVLKPLYEKTGKTLDITNQLREDSYNSKKKELKKITDLLLSYNKVGSSYREKMLAIAPPDIDRIFTEVNQVISGQGLLIQTLSIEELDVRDPKVKKKAGENNYLASGDLGKLKISVAIKGSDYEALKNLLYALENNLRLMDVESLSFDPKGNSVNLVIATYYAK